MTKRFCDICGAAAHTSVIHGLAVPAKHRNAASRDNWDIVQEVRFRFVNNRNAVMVGTPDLCKTCKISMLRAAADFLEGKVNMWADRLNMAGALKPVRLPEDEDERC